jgi:Protein of unknown function (DUF2442)
MKLHTIKWVKPLPQLGGRLQVCFEDGSAPVIDLSPILARGGMFEPLSGPLVEHRERFAAVEVGPRGRTLVWRVGEDVVDLCADALWLMAHPEERIDSFLPSTPA